MDSNKQFMQNKINRKKMKTLIYICNKFIEVYLLSMKHNYFIVESGSKREQMYCYGDMTKPGLHSFSSVAIGDSKYTLHYSPIEKIEYVLVERHSWRTMQKATSF